MRRAGDDGVEGVKHQPHQPGSCFDAGVPEERLAKPFGTAPGHGGADRHPAEKNHQDQDLCVGAVTEEQTEVPAPDRFVDEPGGTGEHEERAEQFGCGSDDCLRPAIAGLRRCSHSDCSNAGAHASGDMQAPCCAGAVGRDLSAPWISAEIWRVPYRTRAFGRNSVTLGPRAARPHPMKETNRSRCLGSQRAGGPPAVPAHLTDWNAKYTERYVRYGT